MYQRSRISVNQYWAADEEAHFSYFFNRQNCTKNHDRKNFWMKIKCLCLWLNVFKHLNVSKLNVFFCFEAFFLKLESPACEPLLFQKKCRGLRMRWWCPQSAPGPSWCLGGRVPRPATSTPCRFTSSSNTEGLLLTSPSLSLSLSLSLFQSITASSPCEYMEIVNAPRRFKIKLSIPPLSCESVRLLLIFPDPL